ncbi:MAG: N-acyl-D-glucosamine 2-epimerase [Moorea sp. SIO3C2]|nr:N-acyl-D-glucosamine 2-epimerase [Moorena sp. SIO3C2]
MIRKYRFYLYVIITTLVITLIVGLSPTISQPILLEPKLQTLTGERWLQHVEEDLNPWWLMETAFGKPVGNFPSLRCDNGELLDLSQPCPIFKDLEDEDNWIKNYFNKKHIVAHSRQIYTYGVAYQLTGNPKFLSLAKSGLDWIRKYGFDREKGGVFTVFSEDNLTPLSSVSERNSQELAYALQGMAFYYYLTQDEEVLPDIIKLKDFIFENYYDSEQDIILQLPKNPQNQESKKQRKGIVYELDQMNTYLMLLAPILPEPYQSQWKKDLVHISRILMNQFYSPEYNNFWYYIDNAEDKKILTGKTDYGHSIKTLWMIYLTGKLVNNERFITFARTSADKLFKEAYDSESGTWYSRLYADKNKKIIKDLNKSWWIYAELDQVAGTLSLENSSYVDKYLKSTVNWWFKHMVDHTNHGIWHKVIWPTLENKGFKQWKWKNGFHSYEHALVGYITTQATQGEKVKLYFARKEGKENKGIRPYYNTGKIEKVNKKPLQSIPEMNQIEVSFTEIN